MIGNAVSKIGEVGTAIWNKIKEFPSKFLEVGKNMVQGIWNGISNAKDWVLGKIKGFGESILNGIKSFFGIHSPSTVFRDQIGENLALGIGEGFTDEMANVTKDMQNAMPTSLDTSINTGVNGAMSGLGGLAYDNIVSAFKDALAGVKVVLDDEEMGTFIDRTVTNIVYN
jgi:phage-related protein